ncbi:MAG: exodeoxyribonuclease VII large subunit [Rhodobacteraceae bacterium]|nr:exodeoxyribonuclease VII large subunit [Paracoccaceae bacterium]MCY4195999.1 exodeoxyribonuclease VII large subunit [Paracoccaceae bacterium]MCY4328227.1 exodeoxyribonuclease VII large subunit [Paracoccaceae bacterium]
MAIDPKFSEPGGNVPEFSVAEISQHVRNTIETNFSRVSVRGEASGVSVPRSGHVYLKLVQDQHQLDAVIWRGRARSLGIVPQDGVEYLATGKLTAYSGKSNYQLSVDKLEAAGEGALLARLEKLKAELQAEGLFDAERKQGLPTLPSVIGVVSSPGGAVIRDILHVLHDRFPRHVLLWPVAAQGPSCADEVARAIRGFNALDPNGVIPRPDLLIVARGGGSVEDLAGFSDGIVVRAAAMSSIPLISAVGHETDTPLIDLAADQRAPTPSVAAEKAVPARRILATRLSSLEARLTASLTGKTENRRQRLRDLTRGLPRLETLFAFPAQRLDHAAQSLTSNMRSRCQENELRLARLTARLRQPEIIAVSQKRYAALAGRHHLRLVQQSVQSAQMQMTRVSDKLPTAGHGLVLVRRQRLAEMERLLESLSYTQTLKRGYAVIKSDDRLIDSSIRARQQTHLAIEFFDGRVNVDVIHDD